MQKEPVPQYTIRKATVDDTVAIRHVQAASWLATYPNDEYGVSEEWVKAYTDSWLTPEKLEESKGYIERAISNPSGYYRVAEVDGEIIGFIHGSTNEDDTKELEAIYTRPDMFGKGLGPQLITLFIEWAGDSQSSLEAAVYNERALRFYRKYGFKEVAGTEYLYRDKIPVIKMVREINNEI